MTITFKRTKFNKNLYHISRENYDFTFETKCILKSAIIEKGCRYYIVIELNDIASENIYPLYLQAEQEFKQKCDFSNTLCVKVPVRANVTQISIIDEDNYYLHRDRLREGMRAQVRVTASMLNVTSERCELYWSLQHLRLL